jgi:hypothetical protein
MTGLGVALAVTARLLGGSSPVGIRLTPSVTRQKPPKVCCSPTLSATDRTKRRAAPIGAERADGGFHGHAAIRSLVADEDFRRRHPTADFTDMPRCGSLGSTAIAAQRGLSESAPLRPRRPFGCGQLHPPTDPLSATAPYARWMQVLIIDGANVMGSRPDGWWRDRPGAARRLHEQLSAAELPQNEVVLVLEGEARRGVPAGEKGRIRTVHAAGSGDDAIVDEVVKHVAVGDRRGVVVVTADRVLRDRVEVVGASSKGPGWLLDQL